MLLLLLLLLIITGNRRLISLSLLSLILAVVVVILLLLLITLPNQTPAQTERERREGGAQWNTPALAVASTLEEWKACALCLASNGDGVSLSIEAVKLSHTH